MGDYVKLKKDNRIIHVIEHDQYESSLKASFYFFLKDYFTSVEDEFYLPSGKRIDFLCKKGSKIVGIEYKTEKNRESSVKIKDQVATYEQELKTLYKKKVKVYLISPQGFIKDSISEAEFLALFKINI